MRGGDLLGFGIRWEWPNTQESRTPRRPAMQLTAGFRALRHRFRHVFTAPTFTTFLYVATGWCLSLRHRYVTELIQSSGATHRGHHSRYHRSFSNAASARPSMTPSAASGG